MSGNKCNIVVCEKCYNIPKITLLNKANIQLYCNKCNETIIKDYSYFEKFLKKNEKINDKIFDLPKCNYNNDHQSKSNLYCFQCSKYLCNECINIHEVSTRGKNHLTIKQNIYHQYYCPKNGHEEYLLDRYCTQCNVYLCPLCKHEHNKNEMYCFEDNNNNILNEIKEKIEKCVQIIKEEEEYLFKFISEIQNKIDSIKNLFDDYKKRNLNIISIYKLLIDNYEQIYKIRNYNINNNIKLNNNFDLESSVIDNSECLNSKYNRLCAFYMNKNHIKTTEYANFYMTKKYCEKEFKKCIILNEKVVLFIKDMQKNIFFIYRNKKNNYKIKSIYYGCFINDIFPFNYNKFIYLDDLNNLVIKEIFFIEDEIDTSTIKVLNNINYVLKDLSDNNQLFLIENNNTNFILKFYINEGDTLELIENNYLLLKKDKKYKIKYIYEDINEIIKNSNLNNNDKENLQTIFIYNNENVESIEKLIIKDNKLMESFDNFHKKLYNELKDKINFSQNEENYYIINSNFIYKTFINIEKNINNFSLTEEEKNKIKYIINYQNICREIRERYLSDLVFNSKINHIYNYMNNYIILIGENYIFNIYSLLNKQCLGLECVNLFQNNHNNSNINSFEVKGMTEDKIILNNSKDKNIYFIETNNNYSFCLLKKTFTYYSNIVINDHYLLFDNLIENNFQFTLIDLSNFSKIEDSKLINLLNIKIDNIPKILLNHNFTKFIYLYDNSQLCLVDYHFNENMNDNNVSKGKIMKIFLSKNNNYEIVPPASFYSSIYENKYDPSKLFSEESYFCTKTNVDQYILFYFKEEYYFTGFKMKFLDNYIKAKPKRFKMTILDNKQRFINEYVFFIDNIETKLLEGNLNDKGAYIRIDLLENFGEKYICIERMNFLVDVFYSIKTN